MENPNFEFVPADILPKLADLKPYTLLLQKKGPNFFSADAQKIIQSEHLPYLFKLREEGMVLLSMPVMDNTDVAAIAIYNSTDKEELKRITDADPAVHKGVFVYDLLNCVGMKGDSLN